jgi:exportin-2 (importin alpha re-exporter)
LASKDYVVHTYAAVCVERVLFIKHNGQLTFTAYDLKPYVQTLLTNLFQIIDACSTPEKMSENDYLMKTVMRVIFISRQDLSPSVEFVLGHLTRILEVISRNPSNPKFNHFVFESIGSLVRFLCTSDPKLVNTFEKLLFPPIQAILQLDIAEFTPYVLQILSQMLELHSHIGVPEAYRALLPPLLQPPLWENHGNVPALVRLLQAYLAQGAAELVASNQLPAILGIFQKLLSSRINDQQGLDLLVSVYSNIPLATLQPYIPQLLSLMLTKLQLAKASRFAHGFTKCICTLGALTKITGGPRLIVDTFNSIQPG